MSNPFAGKSTTEILDDMRAMVECVSSLGDLGFVRIEFTEEQYQLLWRGCWWPDMPPALDLWRLGLPR